MKAKLFFFTILISQLIFGQTWCDEGANWKYRYMSGFGTEGYTEISYIGDTLIEGQLSNKLSKQLVAFDLVALEDVNYDYGYEYTYEENGVVYLWFNNHWDTLYNFQAEIGDSWRMAKQPLLTNDSNSVLNVVAKGMKNINGIDLKYLVVDFDGTWNKDTIVEKVGFIGSYMFPYDGYNGGLDVHEGGAFRCYEDDQFSTYKPYFSGECDFTVSISELDKENMLNIYPNPVSTTLNLKEEIFQNADYKIFNEKGGLMMNGKLSNTIDVSNLSHGLYIITIEIDYNIKSYSFVKN